MPKIKYVEKNFSQTTLEVIKTANAIISEYEAQGFDLTLRQLYYQFVARDLIRNTDREYKRLGSIVNDGRLAGLIDWNSITDRTRNLRSIAHWKNPSEIVDACAHQFAVDKWRLQKYRPEVWIEKDALVGVIEGVCHDLDIPYFSCRGYTSQSEMWSAAQRLRTWRRSGQTPIIFHLGDHDPSGKDMTRDISDRLELFMGGLKLDRLALNFDQIEEFNPPPNPCKVTDSRAGGYIAEFGHESWELDALEPRVIADLIRDAVYAIRDADKWEESEREQEQARELLSKVSDRWDDVTDMLSE